MLHPGWCRDVWLVQAFREKQEAIKAARMKIFVRRGGWRSPVCARAGEAAAAIACHQRRWLWLWHGAWPACPACHCAWPACLPACHIGAPCPPRTLPSAGGPNYQAGLEMMRRLGDEIGVQIEVFGPEASMTGICQLAIDYVAQFDKNGR